MTYLAPLPVAAAAAAAASTTPVAAAAARTLLRPLTRRRVLRPLDQLFGRDRVAVLVLLDQLEPDAPTRLVDLLHDHVEDVAAVDHIFDVTDATRPDVRNVQQAVGPLLQLHERAELRRLHDLRVVELVADLRLLGQRLDRRNGLGRLGAVGGVDEDRAVLLDVDLHVVVGLERADRLAALADHHADLLGIDFDRRDARRMARELVPRFRDRLEHLVEDELACPLRLLELVAEALLRYRADLDVHLQRGDAVTGPRDL